MEKVSPPKGVTLITMDLLNKRLLQILKMYSLVSRGDKSGGTALATNSSLMLRCLVGCSI